MDTFGPDFDDLVDEECPAAPMQPIPVRIDGAVRNQELGSTYGGIMTASGVAYQAAVRILTADPRRRLALIMPLSQNIRIGRTQGQANAAGAVWPSATSLPVHSRDELWASCAASGQVTDISVVVERWM